VLHFRTQWSGEKWSGEKWSGEKCVRAQHAAPRNINT
jgi:hypothetical protein